MWLLEIVYSTGKWIYFLYTWIKMSKLPPMVYSAPTIEEAIALDFGEINPVPQHKLKKGKIEKGPGTYSKWASLPDLVLEDVFQRLTIKERYYASQVCRNWNRIFYSSRIWQTFILEDKTLTRRKFNYYMGDQFVLDHHRTQLCLHRVARGIRKLIIKPMDNFFNLYEFMRILSYYCENYELLTLINTFDFTFGCEFSAESVQGHDKVFGTGGKLLGALKRLMEDLRGLRHLALTDLLLEKEEAMYLLDNVAYNCCETLKTLRIVNCCKDYFPILHPVVFVNLQKLTISPQHLDDDNVSLLCNTSLRDLIILQTKLTPSAAAVSFKVWRALLKSLPFLTVHHVLEGQVNKPILWQDGAPVRRIVYKTPEIKLSVPCIFNASNIYANTLEVLAYMGLPQYPVKDCFEDRPDTALILLGRCCVFLDTLVVRDRISTATVLLLVTECRNLRRLVVRQEALVLKCDWPRGLDWTDDFYDWLKKTSSSLEDTTKEVSLVLETKWKPLTNEEFSNVRL